jgi:hypothetical protein
MHSCNQVLLVDHASFLGGKEERAKINRITGIANWCEEQT